MEDSNKQDKQNAEYNFSNEDEISSNEVTAKRGSKRIILTASVVIIVLAVVGFIYAFSQGMLGGRRSTADLADAGPQEGPGLIASELEPTSDATTEGTTEASIPTEIHNSVTLEAGETELDAEDFIISRDLDAVIGFTGDVDHVDLDKPGEYPLQLVVGSEIFDVTLIIEDTTPPILELEEDLVMSIGIELSPELFILVASDNTELSFEFIDKPDSNVLEEQTVTIAATDLGGNTTTASTTVNFVTVRSKVVVEAGTTTPLTVDDFKLDGYDELDITEITSLSSLSFDHVGSFIVKLLLSGETEVITVVEVVDTVAPSATAKTLTEVYFNTPIEPQNVLASITDATDVTVTWVKAPNYRTVGQQEVTVRLTDEGGNTTQITAKIEVLKDEVPPVIHGVYDRTYIPGESASLLNGVYATDDRDSNPKLTLDDSNLDESTDGRYKVIYIATDLAGNVTRKEATITVKNRTPYAPKGTTGSAELNRLADNILSQIINGDMTPYEQAYQVYSWISRAFTYRAQTNRTDMVAGGLTGLKFRTGDCYIYRFTNQALLSRAGIPNYGMNADDGSHSWTMVLLGGRYVVSDPLWNYFDVPLSYVQDRANGLDHWDDEHAITQKLESKEEVIKFEINRTATADLYEGEEQIITEGVDGLTLKTYEVNYKDGKEISRKLISDNVITEPVTQQVRYGTRVNTAPVITAPKEITLNIGQTLDLTNAVTVNDKEDGKLSYTVNQQNLNINVVGSYTISISTQDSRGLSSTVSITVKVVDPSPTTTKPTTTPPTTTKPTTTPPTTEPTTTPEPTTTEPTTTQPSTTPTTPAPTTAEPTTQATTQPTTQGTTSASSTTQPSASASSTTQPSTTARQTSVTTRTTTTTTTTTAETTTTLTEGENDE